MNLTSPRQNTRPHAIQSIPHKQEKYLACSRLLKQHYSKNLPETLVYDTPFQLLVAAILCVQSEESVVNMVTTELFAKYPDPEALLAADNRDLQRIIKPTKFNRRKAKHLQLASEMLLAEYGGIVPNELIELTKLPGISRRSAYLILSELYGKTAGIIVDSRVWRVAQRMRFAEGHSAESIETQLVEFVPRAEWNTLNVLFTQHADTFCSVKSPQCGNCPLNTLCDSTHH